MYSIEYIHIISRFGNAQSWRRMIVLIGHHGNERSFRSIQKERRARRDSRQGDSFKIRRVWLRQGDSLRDRSLGDSRQGDSFRIERVWLRQRDSFKIRLVLRDRRRRIVVHINSTNVWLTTDIRG